MKAAHSRYQFGPFVADARKRLLWRDGEIVSLTPKAFQLLLVLLEDRGHVVEKDALVARVWGDTAVEDATLARHISTLRRALDDRLEERQYIVTVPGRGYTFVAVAVELQESAPPPPPAEPTETSVPSTGQEPSAALLPETGSREGRSRSRAIVATLLTAACALLVSGMDLPSRTEADAPRVLRQFTFDGGFQREPAWSPDGRLIAYTSDASGNSDIWVQSPDSRPTRLTTSDAEESQPAWSPDGGAIVFRSERVGGLTIIPASGGIERQLTTFGHRPRWSPDGRFVLFASVGRQNGPLRYYVVAASGGPPALLRPDLLTDFTPVDAAWAPDGRVGVWGRRSGEWMFLVMPVDSGSPLRSQRSAQVDQAIKETSLTLGRFSWSRSGQYLYFEGTSERVRNIWRVTLDPKSLTWVAGPERLTTGAGQDADIAVSPDGTRMVFVTRNSRTRLWSYPFDSSSGRITGGGEPVTSGGAGELDADAPRDGSKLVYTALRGNRQELWERQIADGSERLLIATTEWRRSRPRWSPDGLRLAYLRTRSDASGSADAAVTVLPVGGEERLLTRPGEISLSPTDWSRDGRSLLGSCAIGTPRRSASCQLPVTDDAVGEQVRIVASDPARNLYESRYSPDQRWITFVAIDATDARVSRIYAVPSKGGPWQPLTEGESFDDKPHWSTNGKTLYFLSDRQGFFNVWGRRFDPARGVPIGDAFPVTSFDSPRLTVSPDLPRTQIAVTTTRLILPIVETSGDLWLLDHVN